MRYRRPVSGSTRGSPGRCSPGRTVGTVVPSPILGLRIEEDCVGDSAVMASALPCVAVCATPLPHDLVGEMLGTEDGVEQNLQIVRFLSRDSCVVSG